MLLTTSSKFHSSNRNILITFRVSVRSFLEVVQKVDTKQYVEILKEYVMMNLFFSNLKARVLLPTSSTIHVLEKL